MEITLGGVRGTTPVTGSPFLKYGGHTTAIRVRSASGATLFLDAGTGLVDLAREETGQRDETLLLTHYHLDHLAGLPSCQLLYRENTVLHVVGPEIEGHGPETWVPPLCTSPHWPFAPDGHPAHLEFASLGEAPLTLGDLTVRWVAMHHNEGSVAYRVDDADGSALVLATDVEWRASSPEERAALVALCCEPKPAQCLLFDAHFTSEEYPLFEGWGHSTWEDAVEVAKATGVEKVLLTHHAPEHDDAFLDQVDRQVRAAHPGMRLARQGEVV